MWCFTASGWLLVIVFFLEEEFDFLPPTLPMTVVTTLLSLQNVTAQNLIETLSVSKHWKIEGNVSRHSAYPSSIWQHLLSTHDDTSHSQSGSPKWSHLQGKSHSHHTTPLLWRRLVLLIQWRQFLVRCFLRLCLRWCPAVLNPATKYCLKLAFLMQPLT